MIHLNPSCGFSAHSHGTVPSKNEQEFLEKIFYPKKLSFL